jgi:hypothetical protein
VKLIITPLTKSDVAVMPKFNNADKHLGEGLANRLERFGNKAFSKAEEVYNIIVDTKNKVESANNPVNVPAIEEENKPTKSSASSLIVGSLALVGGIIAYRKYRGNNK